jgi:hypothetical protein
LTGVTNGIFAVPLIAPNSTNVSYRIRLTGTDTNGFQHATTMDVSPQLVQLALASVPPGLELQFESQPFTTPTTITTVAGMTRTVTAPSPQNLAGSDYNFVLWSDGGAATHLIAVPLTNSTLTASFVTPEIVLTRAGDSIVVSWPGWADSLQLMTSTNLAAPDWQVVTNVPVQSSNLRYVQLPMTAAQQFFRLQSP